MFFILKKKRYRHTKKKKIICSNNLKKVQLFCSVFLAELKPIYQRVLQIKHNYEANIIRKQQTWSLLIAERSRYRSTRIHFSNNLTPSSKLKFSCHSSRRIGRARWFPNPVATWSSSKFTPIMLTWIRTTITATELILLNEHRKP